MKINQLFVWKVWMRTLMTHIGLLALIYGVYRIVNNEASLYWLIASYFVNQIFMFTLSVGNHRLFSHRAFKTSRIWEWVLALISPISGNGSAYTWTFIHLGHHQHSDTPKDPYQNDFSYFFRLKHKKIEFALESRVKWMLRDPVHYYTHKYSVLIVIIAAILTYSVSLNCLLFAYLIPASFHHLTGGLLIIYTHKNNVPVDRPWYWGIFIPSAGEWYHRSHHEQGHSRRLNNAQLPMQWDMGCWFAKLISIKYDHNTTGNS